jgi:hypothetical protein
VGPMRSEPEDHRDVSIGDAHLVEFVQDGRQEPGRRTRAGDVRRDDDDPLAGAYQSREARTADRLAEGGPTGSDSPAAVRGGARTAAGTSGANRSRCVVDPYLSGSSIVRLPGRNAKRPPAG